jgi:hypothetical protein
MRRALALVYFAITLTGCSNFGHYMRGQGRYEGPPLAQPRMRQMWPVAVPAFRSSNFSSMMSYQAAPRMAIDPGPNTVTMDLVCDETLFMRSLGNGLVIEPGWTQVVLLSQNDKTCDLR